MYYQPGRDRRSRWLQELTRGQFASMFSGFFILDITAHAESLCCTSVLFSRPCVANAHRRPVVQKLLHLNESGNAPASSFDGVIMRSAVTNEVQHVQNACGMWQRMCLFPDDGSEVSRRGKHDRSI